MDQDQNTENKIQETNQPTTKLPTRPIKPLRPDLPTPAERLMDLLARHPGLRGKLLEALETKRFFITLSYQKKKSPNDPHDLQHFWHRQGFMVNDVLPSLRYIANDYKAKENPTAEVEGEGWH